MSRKLEVKCDNCGAKITTRQGSILVGHQSEEYPSGPAVFIFRGDKHRPEDFKSAEDFQCDKWLDYCCEDCGIGAVAAILKSKEW